MAGEDDAVPHDLGVAEARTRVAARASIERADTMSAAATEHVLQAEFGDGLERALRVVDTFVDKLPAAEREQIARGTFDAATVKALLLRAVGPPPATKEAAEAELAAMRKLMGDRNSAYWKGPEAERNQERYGFILRGKEEAAKVKP